MNVSSLAYKPLPEPTAGGEFELAPAGTHLAVCYRFIDLGTQQTVFQGQVKHQPKVMLSWELPECRMKDGRPFSIHQRYTWSMHEKANFRKALEAWRGVPFRDEDFKGAKAFNVANLLGKACLLGIVHVAKDGSTYANISAVLKVPAKMEIPAPSNEVVFFDLARFDQDIFDKLSDGLKAIIAKSPEYGQIHAQRAAGPDDGGMPQTLDDLDDSIPF